MEKENVRLNDLMFKALDHAVDSVSSGGPLIPFVLTESGIQRFMDEDLEVCKLKAEEFLAAQHNEIVITLAYDGFITVQGEKSDAVFVKAFDRNEAKGILIAQRYSPKKLLSGFKTVGNPVMVEEVDNPLFAN